MAKKSAIEKNNRRARMAKSKANRHDALKAIVMDRSLPPEERFAAQMQLNKLPKNALKVRVRNRCEVSGRPRAFYRKFKMSRIALRDLASIGQVPGVVKSSW